MLIKKSSSTVISTILAQDGTTLSITDDISANISVDQVGSEFYEIEDILDIGEINFLGDVNLTSVADNHFLVYNNSSSKWINKSPSDTLITLGITATASELNYNDITTLGTVEASKVVTADANGNVTVTDGDKFQFGTGLDMTLYHDGTHSYLTNAVGTLKLATETSGIAVQIGHSTSEVTIGQNLTVTGNLTVNGTTTTVNSTVTTLDDPILTLGGDSAPSSDDNKDRGVEFRWHDGSAAKVGFFGFDDSTSKFTFIPDATNTSEVFAGSVGNVLFGGGEFSGDLVVDTSVLKVDSANNRVGIGTASPQKTLHVADTTADVEIARFEGADGNIGINGGAKITFSRNAINYLTCTDIGGSLRFETGGAGNNRLTIASDGVSTFTGHVILDNAKSLRLSELDSNGSNHISIKAPDSVTSDVTLVLPDGAGSNGQVLTTNGSGTLSWTSVSTTTSLAALTDTTISAPAAGHILVYDGSNSFDNVALSGDATISSAGVLTIASDAIEAGMLNDNIISGQTAMTGDIADTDEMLVSDGGVIKRADFSVVRDAVFADVSGEASIAAGGALTIDKSLISGQTALSGSDIVASDQFLIGDSSAAGALRRANLSTVITSAIVSRTAETSIADDDLVLIYDTSESTTRKMTKANFVSGLSSDVVADTTPQLGGSLDVNGNDIVSVSNGNITLTPNGSGVVRIDGTSGIDMQSGEISIKNSGSVSNVKFYCEVNNAHYTQLQSAAHANYSGNITLTLPTSTGNLVGTGDTGTVSNTMLANSTFSVTAGDGLSGGGSAALGSASAIALDLNELTAAVVDVANDSVAIIDANDSNASRKESIADLVAGIANTGLTAASGQLSIDNTVATLTGSQTLTNKTLTSAVLNVGVSGTAILDEDDLNSNSATQLATQQSIKAYVDSQVSGGALDIDAYGALGGTGIAQSDHFVFSDAGTEKKVTFSNLEDAIFGNVSGDATIAAGGALTIAAGSVENSMLAGSITANKMNNAIFEDLETLGAASSDGEFIVATGSGAFAYESGATVRTSLGLGTGDSPTFTSLTLSGQAAALAMNSQKITGLATPTADADAATKAYVDSVVQGLDIYDSVKAATTASFTMASTASTTTLVLADGEGGFNATADTLTIDGISLSQNDRVLIKDGVNSNSSGVSNKWNGIYTVGALSGTTLTLTRATDMDVPAEFNTGAFFFVEQGTVNADNGFVLVTDGTVTVGTSNIEFSQFSGAGDITAGSALTKSGNTLNVAVDDSSIEVNSDALRVKASGITSAMLAGSIANSKLNTLTTANKVALSSLDLDGGTEVGADLVDADLIIVDDGGAGTNRSSTLTRVKKYIYSAISGDATASDAGALTIASNAVEGSMLNNNAISGQTEMTGDVADTDELMISDAGTLKRADFSVVRDAVFNDVSGDATIAAGGALTIANSAIESAMLNSNVITGQTAETSIADDDLILISDTSSSGALRKMTKANFVSGLGGGSVAADDIAAGDAAINLTTTSGNITLDAQGSDTDIIFKGTDGGSDTTFLTIDGSDAGTLIANKWLKLKSDSTRLYFGTNEEIYLIHQHNEGLQLGHSASTANTPTFSIASAATTGGEFELVGYGGTSLGGVSSKSINNASSTVEYARIDFEKVSGTTGSENGRIKFKNMFLGDFETSLEVYGSGSNHIVNIPMHNGSSNKGLALGGTTISATAAELNKLDGVTTTTAEFNVIDGDTSATSTTLVDADRVVVNDDGTMKQVALTDVMTYVDANVTVSAIPADNISAGDAAINLTTTAGNITIDAQENNSDIIFKGTDGGSDTTFLTIDGSDAGTLIANHDLKLQSDSARLYFGADNDVFFTHNADTGLTLDMSSPGSNEPKFVIQSSSATSNGPSLIIDHNPSSASTGLISEIVTNGNDSGGTAHTYSKIRTFADNVTDGSEAGRIVITAASGGTSAGFGSTDIVTIKGNASGHRLVDIVSHDGANDGLQLNGTLVTATAAELNKLDGVTTTTAELNVIDGDTSATSTTLVDADRVVVNDNGTMKQVAMTDVMTYVNANVSAGGGSSYTYSAVTAATVTGAAWYHYSVDTSSNAVTINLPALSGLTDGDEIRVKVRDATNTVTIDGNSSETIDGSTTITLNTLYQSVTLVAGSAEWEIV